MDKQFKYRINELLGQMPLATYKKVLAFMPSAIDVKPRTFDYYRAIKLGDEQDIPHAIVDRIEKFFGIPSGTLQNFETKVIPLKEMDNHREASNVAQKFNLVKS